MNDYFMIAEVLKPQGIKGEVKIKPYTADTDSFRDWHTLYRESNGTWTPVSSDVKRVQDDFVYTVLGGCTSMDEAEAFRGVKLYIDRAHAASTEPDEVYIADLIGCRAVDEAGKELGTLSDVLQYGTVDTYVFKNRKKEWMAPALLAVFPEVDPEAGIIRVCSERLKEVAVFED